MRIRKCQNLLRLWGAAKHHYVWIPSGKVLFTAQEVMRDFVQSDATYTLVKLPGIGVALDLVNVNTCSPQDALGPEYFADIGCHRAH